MAMSLNRPQHPLIAAPAPFYCRPQCAASRTWSTVNNCTLRDGWQPCGVRTAMLGLYCGHSTEWAPLHEPAYAPGSSRLSGPSSD